MPWLLKYTTGEDNHGRDAKVILIDLGMSDAMESQARPVAKTKFSEVKKIDKFAREEKLVWHIEKDL